MTSHVRVALVICVFTVLGGFRTAAAAAVKETVRPYKFGFTIAEQQHRAEQKDERGIIMGEFGFITADGIYHVTVYATDEEGKFRILAMRNYPYESPPTTVDMIVRPNLQPRPKTVTSTTPPPATTTRKALPKFQYTNDACSGCSLPGKPPKAPDTVSGFRVPIRPLSKSIPSLNGNGNGFTTAGKVEVEGQPATQPFKPAIQPKQPATQPFKPAIQPKQALQPTFQSKQTPKLPQQFTPTKVSQPGSIPTTPTRSVNGITGSAGKPTLTAQQPLTPNRKDNTNAPSAGNAKGPSTSQLPSSTAKGVPSNAVSKQPTAPIGVNKLNRGTVAGNVGGTGGTGGTRGTAGTISTSGIGGIGGTSGIGKAADGGGDLYRFKYLLDYNGHKETGSRNGNKEGNYFAIGEDNVERTIEYIANEFGFQPQIRWRKLDSPVQTKENTLKDYEFVWFKES